MKSQTSSDQLPLSRRGFAAAILCLVIVGSALSARAAEKMDSETHTLLIDKLGRVLEHGPTAGADQDEIRLRLADLLAERARLSIVAAEGRESESAKRDRQRALKQYQIAVERTSGERQARVLLQMAHLHDALGSSRTAVRLYDRIAKNRAKSYPEMNVGRALTAWGDVLFRQGRFADALSKFERALRLKKAERRGYVLFRVAWCHLNLGHQQTATRRLVEILRSPALMSRRSSDGREELDLSFQEDIARDLVIFLARGRVTPDKVRLLLSLSPEANRRENLRSLAAETERLGKRKEAIDVWSMVLEQEPSAIERIDGRVRLAILEWGRNHKSDAVGQFRIAMDTWAKSGCSDREECSAIQARSRKWIVDWNRLEKERVTPQLLQAYDLYNARFDEEFDMQFWAAQTARLLKKFNEAAESYRRCSVLAHRELQKREVPATRQMFEAALVAQIEMAETGGNLPLKLKSYEHYLSLNPQGDRSLEVRYQRARVFYDQTRYDLAAEEFRSVAMTATKSDAETRKKAADLALDALVLAKQEGRIEGWALEFSQRFQQARVEYLNVARRAVLKDVASISNDPRSADHELRKAAHRLSTIQLEGTTKEERILIFKNHLILAVRTRDLDETRRAADRLLGSKGLSDSDREFALEKKVWSAEMRLDFANAYRWTLAMRMPRVATGDRELRLAYLAELAGRSPTRHYESVLKSSRTRSQIELAATRLIRLSKRPWRELARHERVLARNRDLFATLVLENYARTRSAASAKKYLARSSVRKTDAGRILARSLAIPDLQAFDKKIAAHRLNTSKERLLQSTLKTRLDLLAQADRNLQSAINASDATLQIIALDIAARENERLYREIIRLPLPRKLSEEQKKQYTQALAEQAAPFQSKAAAIEAKSREFWSDARAIDLLVLTLEKSVGDVTRVIAEDIRQLSLRAPSSVKSRLQSAIRTAIERPGDRQAVSARRALQKNPFSISQTKALKDIEAERGQDAMVAYLDARLNQLEGSVK